MDETKEVQVKIKLEGQPAGGYTINVLANRVTEFSEAHLAFLRTWANDGVLFVTQD